MMSALQSATKVFKSAQLVARLSSRSRVSLVDRRTNEFCLMVSARESLAYPFACTQQLTDFAPEPAEETAANVDDRMYITPTATRLFATMKATNAQKILWLATHLRWRRSLGF